jgi:flagellar basal-body rod modification protein FlgD
MAVNSVNTMASATNKGTRIVKPGGEMDKNAFLRILTAELSNQTPDSAKDSTQYVAQMAQFASLEQMTNLNSTMRMNSANTLIGKFVGTSITDYSTGLQYSGVVDSVSKSGSNAILNVQVNKNGKSEMMQVDISDVLEVADMPDYSKEALNQNLLLLTSSSLIGKKAEFIDKDSEGNNYKGDIKGVFVDGGTIKFKVTLNDSDKSIDLPYTSLKSVSL